MIEQNLLEERMEEVDKLINQIPDRPTSENEELINALCRASLILLCSHFEGVLQDMMTCFIDEINSIKIKYRNLKIEMRIKDSGINDFKNPNFGKMCSLLNGIETNVVQNKVFRLDKAKFNKTGGNPSPDVINDLFRHLGRENILDDLNERKLSISKRNIKQPFLNQTEKLMLKEHLDENQISFIESLLKENRSKTVKEKSLGFYHYVNTLLDYRNSIVHGDKDRKISKYELVQLKEQICYLIDSLIEELNNEKRRYLSMKSNQLYSDMKWYCSE